MKALGQKFADYSSYHRTGGNQVCHMIGIPLIVVTVFGLLSHLVPGGGLTGLEWFRVDGGTILWALASVWYVRAEWRLGLPFAWVTLGLYFVGRALPIPALWTLFVLGWIAQYFGHYHFERRSPAFYKNAEHLLVGPLWVFAKVLGRS
jgi:uncharacterized membrane protein YGL010W